MSAIEDRLRDAMAARARTVRDDDLPLPAPRAGGGRFKIAAAALAITVTAFGLVRLAAPQEEESTLTVSLSAVESAGRPVVSVFLCMEDDVFASCKSGEATDAEREKLRRAMERRPDVESVSFEDRQQAWENFRRNMTDKPELLRTVVPSDLPEAFRVQVRPGADFSAVARAASEFPGVSNSVDGACIADRLSAWGSIKRWLGSKDECSFGGTGR
jgi:cell division protein FtsX